MVWTPKEEAHDQRNPMKRLPGPGPQRLHMIIIRIIIVKTEILIAIIMILARRIATVALNAHDEA